MVYVLRVHFRVDVFFSDNNKYGDADINYSGAMEIGFFFLLQPFLSLLFCCCLLAIVIAELLNNPPTTTNGTPF